MFQNYSSALVTELPTALTEHGNQFVATFYNRYPKAYVKSQPETV